jgi:hypothetical protein
MIRHKVIIMVYTQELACQITELALRNTDIKHMYGLQTILSIASFKEENRLQNTSVESDNNDVTSVSNLIFP